MVSLPLNYNLHPPFLPSVQMFCPQLCKHLLAKGSGASYLNFIRLFSHIENGENNSTIGPPQSCCEMKETIHTVCLAQCLICCYILISPPHSPTSTTHDSLSLLYVPCLITVLGVLPVLALNPQLHFKLPNRNRTFFLPTAHFNHHVMFSHSRLNKYPVV